MTKLRLAALVVIGAAVVAAASAIAVFRPRLTAVERGRRLAEANGCFACHGPEGIRGAANPGRAEKSVPDYEGTLMMYAESEDEIREWIRDGAPQARRESASWVEEQKRGVLRMPAFGRRLSERQIEDLVAFVSAMGGLRAPEDSLAIRGRERADALGCTGCHGVAGRFARPNPGALKGYVPPWDGPDFPELVRDRQEFREWVEDGVSRRFGGNPIARFFLDRAPLRMPAYRDHLEPGDVDVLWAYVQWLRAERS